MTRVQRKASVPRTTRAQPRRHAKHDMNTEHDFPVVDSTKDSLPQPSIRWLEGVVAPMLLLGTGSRRRPLQGCRRQSLGEGAWEVSRVPASGLGKQKSDIHDKILNTAKTTPRYPQNRYPQNRQDTPPAGVI